MADYRFKTPLTEADMRGLRVGDSVTLDGVVFGVRDANLIRVFDNGVPPPVDWHGAALLHTAPNVRKVGPGQYEPLSVGTTTSMRMDRFTEGLLRDYGVRAILGKGGLSQRSAELMKQYGACYLSVTGGAAAMETLQIEEIEKAYWEDLMPEINRDPFLALTLVAEHTERIGLVTSVAIAFRASNHGHKIGEQSASFVARCRWALYRAIHAGTQPNFLVVCESAACYCSSRGLLSGDSTG
jgi:L(+)-tartrate dehydratase beta subunit